jgi:hypothetical protein
MSTERTRWAFPIGGMPMYARWEGPLEQNRQGGEFTGGRCLHRCPF